MTESIFEVLREDHGKQRTLLNLVDKTHSDSRGRQELFGRLKKELLAHAAVEERVFYSTLMADETSRDKAGHSVKEHHEAEEILTELEEADMSSTGWLTRFRTLADEVRHHLEEEEQGVFQLAGKVLSKPQQEQMAQQYRSEREDE